MLTLVLRLLLVDEIELFVEAVTINICCWIEFGEMTYTMGLEFFVDEGTSKASAEMDMSTNRV